jgi:hypothetical protein
MDPQLEKKEKKIEKNRGKWRKRTTENAAKAGSSLLRYSHWLQKI